MDSLDGQKLFQSRLCQQLSLLTAVSESLTDRLLNVESRLQQLEELLTDSSDTTSADWEGAADLLSGTEERLSRLERLLEDGVPPQAIGELLHEEDPFPSDDHQEFPEEEPQLFPEEQQGLLSCVGDG